MRRHTFWIGVCAATALITAAGEETVPKESSLRLEVDLVDGSRLIGVPAIATVPVQTSYAKMDVPLAQIQSLKIGDDHETATLDLRNGDKLSGVLRLSVIELTALFGKTAIGLEHVKRLLVYREVELPPSIRKGLVLHYSFDKDEGARAVDRSEKENNGAIHGATRTVKGRMGSAYEFDGVDDRIEVTYDASLFPGEAFTLCAWIYRRDAGTACNIISATYNNPPDRYLYLLNASADGKLGLHSYEGGPLYRAESEPALAADRWHFVCGTFDAGADSKNAKVYVDGRLLGTADHRAPLRGYDGPLNIGCYQNRAGGARYRDHFKGILDDVMIWDRALSEAEVRQLYEAL